METGRVLRNLAFVLMIIAVGAFGTNCKKRSHSKKTKPPPCTPAVNLVTPDNGDIAGGDTILVFTDCFQDDFQMNPPLVLFGVDPSPTVTPLTSNTLQAVTPAHAVAETVDVEVRGTLTIESAFLVGGFDYTDNQPPPPPTCTVSGATPNQGDTAGGQTVFVSGTDFDAPPLPTPTVEFRAGNFATNVFVQSTTQLRVTSPPGAAGFADIIVTDSKGSCVAVGAFEYVAPPPPPTCTITSINPTFGPDFGGTDITINGTGFVGSSRVWVGAVEVTPVTYLGPTQLRVTSPPGAGTVGISVDIGSVSTCDLLSSFTYITCGGGCQLQSVTPNSGGMGDSVTLNGNNLENGALVFFGNAPNLSQATVTSYAGVPNTLIVDVPSVPGGGTVDVEVVNPSGSCCSRNNAFTFTGCTITSLSRSTGPDTGGTPVTIYGQGFTTNPAPEVWFGTAQSTNVIPQSSTEIIAVSPPAGGQTIVDVMVVNSGGGTCACTACFDYGGCVINSITPNTGGTNGGDVVTISGTGFDTFSVKVTVGAFFADPANITFTPTQITFVAPPSPVAGAMDVKVFNELLMTECTEAGGYTYVLPGGGSCSISSITPNTGALSGGTTVTISGSGFDANTGVIFSEIPAQSVIYNAGSGDLTVVTPTYVGPLQQPPIPVDVIVAPENSNPCISNNGFIYQDPTCPPGCSISGLSPNSGPSTGGNTITVTGSGFCDFGARVMFGGINGTTTVIDANTLEVVVPASASGPGAVDVVYVDQSGCFTFPPCQGCYTYN